MTTTVASSATEAQLAAANGGRSSLSVRNTSAYTLYFSFGSSTVTTANAQYTLSPNQQVSITPPESHLEVRGIWSAADAGGAVVGSVTEAVTGGNNTIQTYGELKTSIAVWLKPNTTLPSDETSNRIPEYVSLVEAEINRRLRTADMKTVEASLTVTNGAASVPTGMRQAISMKDASSPYHYVEYLPIAVQEQRYPSASGQLAYFDVIGSVFKFWPLISGTLRLYYLPGLSALSDDSDTNWCLAKHPDAYLYGALRHGHTRLIDPEALQLCEMKFENAMRQITEEQIALAMTGLRMRPSAAVV